MQDIIRDELLNPDNKGSILTIYHKLKDEYPFISINIINMIKGKSKSYRLSEKYDVDKIVFPKSERIIFKKFPDESIDIVISELLDPVNNGSPKRVYEKLKDTIPDISYHKVKDIKRKRKYYLNRSKIYDLKNIVFPEPSKIKR